MSADNNELVLVYKSDEPNDLRALYYVESLRTYHVSTIDVSTQEISPGQFMELANKLHVMPVDLINDEEEAREVREMGPDGNRLAISDLKKNHKLLRTPIAIVGDQANFWNDANPLIRRRK